MSIKILSNSLKYVFLLLIGGSFLMIALSWLSAPDGLDFQPWFSFNVIHEKYKIMYEMSAWHKFCGFLLTFIYACFSYVIYWMLYKLFDAFSKGDYFSLRVIKFTKSAGLLYLIKELVAPFYEAIFSFFLTYQNPEGYRVITVSFTLDNLENILLGLILFVIAHIMSEGLKLKQDSEFTI